jgi:hypothetical protein
MAFVGHVSVHILHFVGSQSVPPSNMGSGSISAVVKITPKRCLGPNSGVRTILIQPNSPSPAATAAWRKLIWLPFVIGPVEVGVATSPVVLSMVWARSVAGVGKGEVRQHRVAVSSVNALEILS